jgi:hypothetical protein
MFMSQYDGLLEEITTQFEWLVQTGDKSVVPVIRKHLTNLKQQLDTPIETMPMDQVVDEETTINPAAKPDRLAAARAAKAQKAAERASLLAQNSEGDVPQENDPIAG